MNGEIAAVEVKAALRDHGVKTRILAQNILEHLVRDDHAGEKSPAGGPYCLHAR